MNHKCHNKIFGTSDVLKVVLHHWNSENWKQFFFAKNVPKYKMYLNDYISKSIQDTVGRYVRWGIGMGVIFLITNRVNKQIIPQTKVWIINVIKIKYLAHLMYLRWYYTIEKVALFENWKQFFSLKMSLNIRCTKMTISLKVYKILLAGMWGEG